MTVEFGQPIRQNHWCTHQQYTNRVEADPPWWHVRRFLRQRDR